MAKFPRSGARRDVAKFVSDRLIKEGHDNLKTIQPQILTEFNDVFFWSVKIISIHKDTTGVGIQRKYEFGFEVVEDKDGKFKSKLRIINDDILKKKKNTKKSIIMRNGRKR